MKFINLTILIAYVLLILPLSAVKAETSGLIITEIQTGSLESASEEFIEIYNPSNSPLNLEGIVVQYKSANGSSWQAKSELSGWVDSKSFVLIATESYFEEVNFTFNSGLSGTGGHIRIHHEEDDHTYDKVGWGTAADAETSPAVAPARGYSIKRVTNEDGKFVDTENNEEDFFESESPSPEYTESYLPEEEPEEIIEEEEENPSNPIEEEPAEEEVEPTETQQEYLVIQITELFIDPEAPLSDSEDEYIELYNPNSVAVNLKDYQLVTGTKSTYSYIFNDTIIEPGQFIVMYSRDTGLTLSNTQGVAKLLSPDGDELFSTGEYENAKPGVAWVLKDGTWQWSSAVTPGSANVVSSVTSKKSSSSKSAKKASSKKASTKKSGSTKGDEDRSVYSEPAAVPADINSYVLVGAGSLAVLYALYEYRHDIGNRIHQVRRYFSYRR